LVPAIAAVAVIPRVSARETCGYDLGTHINVPARLMAAQRADPCVIMAARGVIFS